MQAKELVSQLKSGKFTKTSTNRIADKNGNLYFVLGSRGIISLNSDEPEIPFEQIINVSHTVHDKDGKNNTISIGLSDGSFRHFENRPPTEDDVSITIRNTPQSLSELNDMFADIYPDVREQLYYDELRERIMVNTAMFGLADEIKPLNDAIATVYYDDMERKLIQMNCIGNFPPQNIRDQALIYQANQNRRNLFREWMESQVWDGKPRLRRWFIDIAGATAPALESSGANGKAFADQYLENVTEAWFMGAVARQYQEAKVEIVPILISSQGIGKGNALRYTAGSDDWYIDTNADIRNVDRFLDGIRGRVVVELSESTQIRNSDSEALKAFISKTSDQLRRAYAHFEEVYVRHFVMIASSNIDTIFTDVTGNRRYFPFYCDTKRATRDIFMDRDDKTGSYEVAQLWAEALQMYRDGHPWYLDYDTSNLALVMQEYSTVDNPGIETIDTILDARYPKVGDMVTKTDIMEQVFNMIPGIPIPKEYETAYRAWAYGAKCWQKLPNKTRIGNRVSKGYVRIAAPGQLPKPERLNIVSAPKKKTAKKDPRSEEGIKDWFRKLVKARKVNSFQEFDVSNIPDDHIALLVRKGFIAEVDRRNGRSVYKAVLGADTPKDVWETFGTYSPKSDDDLDDLDRL